MLGRQRDEEVQEQQLRQCDGRGACVAAARASLCPPPISFAPLPPTFWERSQFVKPRDREVVCHASAWDIDAIEDLRLHPESATTSRP